MERSFATDTMNTFDLRTDRHVGDFATEDYEAEERARSAREILGLNRDLRTEEDTRRDSRETFRSLYADRADFEEAEVESGYDMANVKSGAKLFVGSAYDDSFSEISSKRQFTDADLMPSSMTMRYAGYAETSNQAFGIQQQQSVATAPKTLSKKQKITIAIGSALVAAAVGLIVLTGMMINAISSAKTPVTPEAGASVAVTSVYKG